MRLSNRCSVAAVIAKTDLDSTRATFAATLNEACAFNGVLLWCVGTKWRDMLHKKNYLV